MEERNISPHGIELGYLPKYHGLMYLNLYGTVCRAMFIHWDLMGFHGNTDIYITNGDFMGLPTLYVDLGCMYIIYKHK